MSLKIDDDNYQTYKKVFEILCRHLHKEIRAVLPADTDPVTILTAMESKNKSIAKRGLKAGLLDIISEIKEHPKTTISDVNADLEKNGLPNVNKLTGIIRDSLKKFCRQKKLKTLTSIMLLRSCSTTLFRRSLRQKEKA